MCCFFPPPGRSGTLFTGSHGTAVLARSRTSRTVTVRGASTVPAAPWHNPFVLPATGRSCQRACVTTCIRSVTKTFQFLPLPLPFPDNAPHTPTCPLPSPASLAPSSASGLAGAQARDGKEDGNAAGHGGQGATFPLHPQPSLPIPSTSPFNLAPRLRLRGLGAGAGRYTHTHTYTVTHTVTRRLTHTEEDRPATRQAAGKQRGWQALDAPGAHRWTDRQTD